MPDLWGWLTDSYAGLPDMDEVAILRVAYTVAAVLGVPCALICVMASVSTWRAVQRARINGGIARSAKGYLRRDRYRVLILGLIATAGIVALAGSLSLRSVFGLIVLLVIALLTTHDAWCDYQERKATVEKVLP